MTPAPRIDALQYCAWSEASFAAMAAGGLDAVHATLAYHEGFREAVGQLEAWHRRFREHAHRIRPGRRASDIAAAKASGRTAIFLGFQTPAPLEDDPGLLEVWKDLGLSFCQISYNRQSLLASGWTESTDGGLTLMGREAVAEMNRLGIVVDLSHAGERSALEAIEASERPVAATHANPRRWRDTGRNVGDAVIEALAETGGMLGLSLYPHHLSGGSDCTLEAFSAMAAGLAERHGAGFLGIGSDLCTGQPDSVVDWMRRGRWRAAGDRTPMARFPDQPAWFRDASHFSHIGQGLRDVGFSETEVAGVLGGNWARFLDAALEPEA